MKLYHVGFGGSNSSTVLFEPLRGQNREIVDARHATQIDHARLVVHGSLHAQDIVSIIGGYFLVSDRAKCVIEQHRLPPELAKVPVDVVSAADKKLKQRLWWLSTLVERQVLDYEKSGCEFLPGTKFILRVQKWVVREERIPPFDLFRGDKLRWIASEELKRAIESSRLTNFDFDELIVI